MIIYLSPPFSLCVIWIVILIIAVSADNQNVTQSPIPRPSWKPFTKKPSTAFLPNAPATGVNSTSKPFTSKPASQTIKPELSYPLTLKPSIKDSPLSFPSHKPSVKPKSSNPFTSKPFSPMPIKGPSETVPPTALTPSLKPSVKPKSANPMTSVPFTVLPSSGSPITLQPSLLMTESANPLTALPFSAVPINASPLTIPSTSSTPSSKPSVKPKSANPLTSKPISAISSSVSPSVAPYAANPITRVPFSSMPVLNIKPVEYPSVMPFTSAPSVNTSLSPIFHSYENTSADSNTSIPSSRPTAIPQTKNLLFLGDSLFQFWMCFSPSGEAVNASNSAPCRNYTSTYFLNQTNLLVNCNGTDNSFCNSQFQHAFPGALNFGRAGSTISQVQTIVETDEALNALSTIGPPTTNDVTHIVVSVGTNNLKFYAVTVMINLLRKLVNSIRLKFPNASILLLAVTPTYYTVSNNVRVVLNREMKSTFGRWSAFPFLRFADQSPYFINNSTGRFDPLAFVDQIHLSKFGYSLYEKAIKDFLRKSFGFQFS